MGERYGAGVYAPLTGSSLLMPLGEQSTLFQAEIVAIEYVVEYQYHSGQRLYI